MNKIEKENKVFKLAEPLLRELYGHFVVDIDQKDKPDAAITLANGKRVGVEITSVDNEEDLRYFNDVKYKKHIIREQIDNINSGMPISEQVNKKKCTNIHLDYICSAVFKKNEKFNDYMKSGNYEEIIIIAFSEYLSVDNDFFQFCVKPWTFNSLHDEKFLFNKVIFVNFNETKPELVFDCSKPKLKFPSECSDDELEIERFNTQVLPFNQKIPLEKSIQGEPNILPPKQRDKLKK